LINLTDLHLILLSLGISFHDLNFFKSVLKSLIFKISSESSEDKKKMIQLLKFELKEVGSVLTDLVPEIEILIGKQEDANILSRSEEIQKRLFNTITTFFNCFTLEGTLILVLDDLQWADGASFTFLEHLLSLKDKKIFIIGAYLSLPWSFKIYSVIIFRLRDS
jgi:predicted ATPase